MSNLKPVSCRDVRMVLTGVLQRNPFTSCSQLVFASAFAPYNFDDFSQAKGSFHGSFFS